MTNDFLIWLGWNVDNTFMPPSAAAAFWSSPLGLTCTAALCITGIIRVAHYRSNVGFFDTLWHMLMTLTAGAGFVIGLEGNAPHHLVKTMIILMAIRGVYKTLQLHRRQRKA